MNGIQFDQWLSINPYATGDYSADKKQAVFCTLIGMDTFELLHTLSIFKPSTSQGNADALSRLPLDQDQDWVELVEEIDCAPAVK